MYYIVGVKQLGQNAPAQSNFSKLINLYNSVMHEDLERVQRALLQDWEAAGGYISAALHEVASSLGGEAVAAQVANLTTADSMHSVPEASEDKGKTWRKDFDMDYVRIKKPA